MGADLRETVAGLLAQLDGPNAENALCDLRSLRGALPWVVEAYRCESDGPRRERLIHCLWQFRDIAALPTLSAALRDPDERVWKEALDGIVTVGGDATLRLLEEAHATGPRDERAKTRDRWIDEAITQIRGNSDSNPT